MEIQESHSAVPNGVSMSGEIAAARSHPAVIVSVVIAAVAVTACALVAIAWMLGRVPSKATVTMSQAIATAEQQAGGKATRAKLENETGKLLYEIKVAGKDKVTEVKVDAQDGKVLASGAETHGPKRGAEKR